MGGGAVALVAIAALAVACSDDSGGSTTAATGAPPAAPCAAGDPVLRVDLIQVAAAAVDDALGGPQQFFEVNATALLVNLFVARSNGTTATPYVYVDGTLTADEPLPGASGSTFTTDALSFDPRRVTGCVAVELPESEPTVFEVVGGPNNAVRYSVAVASTAGGQLVVEVAGDGTILSVDPV